MLFRKKKDKKNAKQEVVEEVAVKAPVKPAPAPAPVQEVVAEPIAEAPLEAIPVGVVQAKSFVVNCHKCGAALTLKSGKTAYICPVCNSLLRMRMGTRIVKDIPVKEKYIHLTLTQEAARHILHADRNNRIEAMRKSAVPATEKSIQEEQKMQRNVQSALESLLAQHIGVNKYDEGDVLVIDVENNGLTISSAKMPKQN